MRITFEKKKPNFSTRERMRKPRSGMKYMDGGGAGGGVSVRRALGRPDGFRVGFTGGDRPTGRAAVVRLEFFQDIFEDEKPNEPDDRAQSDFHVISVHDRHALAAVLAARLNTKTGIGLKEKTRGREQTPNPSYVCRVRRPTVIIVPRAIRTFAQRQHVHDFQPQRRRPHHSQVRDGVQQCHVRAAETRVADPEEKCSGAHRHDV